MRKVAAEKLSHSLHNLLSENVSTVTGPDDVFIWQEYSGIMSAFRREDTGYELSDQIGGSGAKHKRLHFATWKPTTLGR